MGRLLKVGQLLLGKLRLAVGNDNQRLVLDLNVYKRTARSELLLKEFGSIDQGDFLQGLEVWIVGVVVVGYVDVMQARKIERHLLILQKRRGIVSQRYMLVGHRGGSVVVRVRVKVGAVALL